MSHCRNKKNIVVEKKLIKTKKVEFVIRNYGGDFAYKNDFLNS